MASNDNKTVNRRPYMARPSRWWWTQNSFYRWYMLREGSCLFVFCYSLILMTGLLRLSQGEQAWEHWLQSLQHPLYQVFHVLALLAVLYHAYTWFKLAPKIMVLRIGSWTLPEQAMILGQWCAFVLCALTMLAVVLWGGM